jgi:hypothetical protein
MMEGMAKTNTAHALAAFYGGHRDIFRSFVSISPDETKWTKVRLPKSVKR